MIKEIKEAIKKLKPFFLFTSQCLCNFMEAFWEQSLPKS